MRKAMKQFYIAGVAFNLAPCVLNFIAHIYAWVAIGAVGAAVCLLAIYWIDKEQKEDGRDE